MADRSETCGNKPPELWDPFKIVPRLRWWLWGGLAVIACLLVGPKFVRSFRPEAHIPYDFFQDWASARNVLEGIPVYTKHLITFDRYLVRIQQSKTTEEEVIIPYNAHPPTSVLIMLPFALLDYPDAMLTWNLLSLLAFLLTLRILARQLAIPVSLPGFFPFLLLLLICNPLRQQIELGQWNFFLLFLIVGIWTLERQGFSRWAGTLLGFATAIKLFPGFLFLYYAARRQWMIVASGVVTFILLTACTVAVLSPSTYADYYQTVLPSMTTYPRSWGNASITGFWGKLFNPISELDTQWRHPWTRIYPVYRNALLARWGAGISCLLLVVLLLSAVRNARTRLMYDRTFGLSLVVILLVSPITWDHYLLFLAPTLALTWQGLPRSIAARYLFSFIVVIFWLSPYRFHVLIPGGPKEGVATPVQTLALLSWHFYALMGLFFLGWRLVWCSPDVTQCEKNGLATV